MKKKDKKIFGIPANSFYLGLISFLNDLSSEMLLNLMPIFLTDVLGVKTRVVGIIEGVADSTASILKIVSGYISDKIGKKKGLVIIGYILSGISKMLFYFASSWKFLLGLRFTDRVGKGLRSSAKDALIANTTEKNEMGKAFGFNRAMDTLGAVTGLFLAAFIIYIYSKGAYVLTAQVYRKLVVVAIVPIIISWFIGFYYVEDVEVKEGKKVNLSFKDMDESFKFFLLIVLIFTLGNSSDAFLTLRAKTSGMNIFQICIMLGFFNLVYASLSIPAGILSDKFGRKKLIIAGWIAYSIIYLLFAVAKTPSQFILIYSLYGIYYGLIEGVARAYIADIVPADKRGTAYGIYNGVVGITIFPASYIAGYLFELNPSYPFIFGSLLSFTAVVLFIIFSFKYKK